MQSSKNVSRRRFLKSTGALSGTSLLRIGVPSLMAITEAACTAKQEGAPFQTLSASEAADMAAIAARIMPTTDTPGATEAGVIYFIDRAVGDEMSWALGDLQSGLDDLNVSVAEAHPDKSHFSELPDDAQDDLIAAIEDSALFGLSWMLTMFGFFAMSRYGGNKENIAWDLIGFEGNHGAWQTPFGYYDAEYAKENADG